MPEDFQVSNKSEEHTGELKPNLDTSSTVNEVRRHDKAVGRYDILKDYIAGAISARVAMETLCVKKSRFYKLLKAMQGATVNGLRRAGHRPSVLPDQRNHRR